MFSVLIHIENDFYSYHLKLIPETHFQSLVVYILILIPSTRKQYRHLFNFAYENIFINSETSSRINVVCEKMATDLLTSTIKTTILMIFSISLTVCIPFYQTLFTDQRQMIIVVILPFTDPETYEGFMINFLNQVIFCAVGYLILPGVEIVLCVLKNAAYSTAAVIDVTLLEFEESLMENGFSNESIWRFRNIILKISDFDRFDLLGS